MTSLGLGGCLADDMGLGKTITSSRSTCTGARTAPTLVVCPASLLGNWQREISRFAPGVPVRRFHGTGPHPRTASDGGFVLTTYGTMRSQRAAARRARPGAWSSPTRPSTSRTRYSATAKALRTIPRPRRVALTGTPVENNLSELWALLDWTTPGLLGPLKAFRARHARDRGEHRTRRPGNEEAVERLARLVRPFLLRRKKSDPGIAPELPPKTETDHPVSLTREQATLYEAVVRETMAAIEAAEGIARRGLVLKLLTSLKQICNHPAQYLKEEPARRLTGRSGKLELLDELLDTILAEDGSVAGLHPVRGDGPAARPRTSPPARSPSQLLHGGTPVPEREEMVDRFQAGEVPVFLLSLKAAGTGLNLTRAGHVIHFDRWWNPAVEEQATDRAYRIGQTQPVQVHRLIAEGTVEDRIAEMLESKRALADAVLGSGEAALTELTDRELADLVSLRRPVMSPRSRPGPGRAPTPGPAPTTCAAPSRRCPPAPPRRTSPSRTAGGAAPGWRRWSPCRWTRPGSPAAARTPTAAMSPRSPSPPAGSSPTSTAAGPAPTAPSCALRTFTDAGWDTCWTPSPPGPATSPRCWTRRCRTPWPTPRGGRHPAAARPRRPGPGAARCPDHGRPCKHAAALCYQTARLLDSDPFVLLLMRGRGERELLDELGRRNAEPARAASGPGPRPAAPAGVRGPRRPRADRVLPPLPAAPPRTAAPGPAAGLPGPCPARRDPLAPGPPRHRRGRPRPRPPDHGPRPARRAHPLAGRRPAGRRPPRLPGSPPPPARSTGELASATGRTTTDLARAVAAWRQGGAEGLEVLETPWDPPAGPFDRARPAARRRRVPALPALAQPPHPPGGHVQLRFGHDGLLVRLRVRPRRRRLVAPRHPRPRPGRRPRSPADRRPAGHGGPRRHRRTGTVEILWPRRS